MHRFCATLIILGCSVVTSALNVDAQTRRVIDVHVATTIDPVSASGIVTSPSGVNRSIPAKAERVSKNTVVVSFQIPESLMSPESFASAMVADEHGNLAFGNVRPISEETPERSWLSLPTCAPDTTQLSAVQGDFSTVQRLVEFRTARRKVLQDKLRVMLSGRLLERLRQLESNFGITRASQLSADLHPLELMDRLSRLNTAMRRYKETKVAEKEQRDLQKSATNDGSTTPQ